MRYSIILLLVLPLAMLSGCGINVTSENTVPTPIFITATLPATAIPLPTETPLPPTSVPTISPIEGTTTTQVNVRAQTSTASANLGTIAQFAKVQIIGKDSSTSWYQIMYAGAPNGIGWIRAEYVQVDAAAEVPVIESVTGNGAGMSGLVIQKINVRSGPGTSFDTLGELNPNDVVFISGKDESGSWAQIEFANSADGKGWAALEFLNMENTDSLPVIGNTSPTPEVVVSESTPQTSALPYVMLDGDTMEAPLARIVFSPLNSRLISINSSISSPDGDTEDWVEFTSYNGSIAIQIFCSEGLVQVELQNKGQPFDTFQLSCMEKRLLSVNANETYLLRISEADPNGSHNTEYTLVLENIR